MSSRSLSREGGNPRLKVSHSLYWSIQIINTAILILSIIKHRMEIILSVLYLLILKTVPWISKGWPRQKPSLTPDSILHNCTLQFFPQILNIVPSLYKEPSFSTYASCYTWQSSAWHQVLPFLTRHSKPSIVTCMMYYPFCLYHRYFTNPSSLYHGSWMYDFQSMFMFYLHMSILALSMMLRSLLLHLHSIALIIYLKNLSIFLHTMINIIFFLHSFISINDQRYFQTFFTEQSSQIIHDYISLKTFDHFKIVWPHSFSYAKFQ